MVILPRSECTLRLRADEIDCRIDLISIWPQKVRNANFHFYSNEASELLR